MRVPYTSVAALAAVLAFPAAASAQFQAVDITNVWAPAELTVKVGEPVTWSFGGTTFMHNVKSDSPNWSYKTPFATAGAAGRYTFTAPGEYTFLCELHGSTMTGKVTVLDASGQQAPPPPPPPASDTPYPNDTPTLTVLEKRDKVAPKLDRVKVTRAKRGVRVAFRLSEDGKVTVKATRGKSVKTRTVEVAKGTRSITLSGLKAGTYRVQISAKDLAGNAAKAHPRASVTVRR